MTISEKDKQYIWHPYTPLITGIENIPIVRSEGALLFDNNGKSYIDAVSSWWVNIHGHAHPYIAEKIYEQAKKLEHVIFAGFTHHRQYDLQNDFSNIFLLIKRKYFTPMMAVQPWK